MLGHRPEGGEVASYEVIEGKSVLSRRNKGDETGVCPVCLRSRKQSSGVGLESESRG